MPIFIVGTSAGVIKECNQHSHTTWEIVLNLQGCGHGRIGKEEYFFEPGTIICQPPNIQHSKSSLDGFFDIFIQPTLFPLTKYVDKNGVILLKDDHTKSYETLMYLVLRTFHGKGANYINLTDAIYETMIQQLLAWIDHSPKETDIEYMKNKLISSFSNPEVSISEITLNSKYCSDHARRRFKKATGMSPMEYITDLRINFAKKLMTENHIFNYSIAEIGAMSGYYDSRYFSRIFKKKTGMTPQQYLNCL